MSMYFLDILACTDVPYSESLISTARSKYAFMSWVPDCLIDYEIVHKSSFACSWTSDIPEFNWSIWLNISFNPYLSYDALSIFLLLMWFHSQPNISPACSFIILTGTLFATSNNFRLPSPPAHNIWLGFPSLKHTSYVLSGVYHSLIRAMSASFT